MKNLLKSLVKSVLIPSALPAAASAADAGIQKKIFGSGATTLTISNEEMIDIMKMIKFLEDASLLVKGVSKTFENEAKEQKGGFLDMLLGTISASLLGNMLGGKGIKCSKLPGRGVIRAGEGKIRVGQDF